MFRIVIEGGKVMEKKAMQIANYVVNCSIAKGCPVSNLKLQKILYYIQAAFLVEGLEAFSDLILPWMYGPVVNEVYQKFKIYANREITEPCEYTDIPEKDLEIIEKVIESYRNYSALNMVEKTHSESPWKDAYDGKKTQISKEVIKKYYSERKELIYGNKTGKM